MNAYVGKGDLDMAAQAAKRAGGRICGAIAAAALAVFGTAAQGAPCTEMEKDYAFFNIVSIQSGKENMDTLVRDILEYRQRTGCRLVLPSLSFHPDAKDPMVKANRLLAGYRSLKQRLAGTDVELGVLVQSVMGHWANDAKGLPPWTRTIDINGKPWRFCPLDPAFRDYIVYFVTELAKEGPVVMLTDDDLLSKNAAECFCPLHTAEANRRLGTKMTSEEYRAAVKAARGGDEAFAKTKAVFDDLAVEITSGTGRLIREAVDKVDPSIRAGACQGVPPYTRGVEAARALAAKGQPTLMRLGTCAYRERSAKDFVRYMLSTFEKECLARDIDVRLDESDTYPHNLWSMSATTFRAKIALAAMSGLNGSKIWFVNMHKGRIEVPRGYTDVIAQWGPYYQALAREVKGSRQAGFVAIAHRGDPSADKTTSYLTWGDRFGGTFGIPWRCEGAFGDKGSIYTLADAEDVARCTDAELRELLSGKLIVDGRAATALNARGFSKLLGVEAVPSGGREALELAKKGRKIDKAFGITEVRECLVGSDQPVLYLRTGSTPVLQNLAEGAKVFSTYVSGKDAGKPAAVFFENELGGRVLTASLDLGLESFEPWCRRGYEEPRRAWFWAALDLVGGAQYPYAVVNPQNMACVWRTKPDGTDLLTVWNVHYDPAVPRLRCARRPSKVETLGRDGAWRELACPWQDGVLTVPVELLTYGFVTLRLK